jgi:hypothetical protein
MKIRNTVNLVLLLKSQMLIKNLEIVKDIYIYIYIYIVWILEIKGVKILLLNVLYSIKIYKCCSRIVNNNQTLPLSFCDSFSNSNSFLSVLGNAHLALWYSRLSILNLSISKHPMGLLGILHIRLCLCL